MNGDRKIMHAIYQNNEKTLLGNKEVKPVEPVQMNIYQSNVYRKDLSWLHFTLYIITYKMLLSLYINESMKN